MSTQLPTFDTYCDNTTPGNALVFDLGSGLRVWYSYKTPVAFCVPGPGAVVVRENVWGPTTGKHLNAIDGGGPAKKARVGGADFEARLAAACSYAGAGAGAGE